MSPAYKKPLNFCLLFLRALKVGLIIFSIIFLQLLTIYLDNKSCMNDFFVLINSGSVATAYSNRGILLTLSRTIFFTIPPLLGYLTTSLDGLMLFYLTGFVIFLNFFITIIQGYIYNKKDFRIIFSYHTQINLFKSLIFLIDRDNALGGLYFKPIALSSALIKSG